MGRSKRPMRRRWGFLGMGNSPKKRKSYRVVTHREILERLKDQEVKKAKGIDKKDNLG